MNNYWQNWNCMDSVDSFSIFFKTNYRISISMSFIRAKTLHYQQKQPESQRSILGPFLFLLYFNDLPDCIPKSRIALFADDTSLNKLGSKANDEVCNEVKTARSWFKESKLTIHTDDCESLGFGTSEPFPFEDFGAENCKNLGIYLDAKHAFKKPIEHVTKKLNKILWNNI